MEANDTEISQLQAELAALQHEIDNGSCVSREQDISLHRSITLKLREISDLKEMRRVAAVQREALDSGFMKQVYVRHEGECPICLEEWPSNFDQQTLVCCGGLICKNCLGNIVARERSTQTCPFCRDPCLASDYAFANSERLREHAELGAPWAQRRLANFLMRGGKGGAPMNKPEAFRLYELAANQGDINALFHLGCIYRRGETECGVVRSIQVSQQFFRLAIYEGSPEALNAIAILNRDEPEGDAAEAVRCFTLAAAQGHAVSQYCIGSLHRKGLCGLKESTNNSLFWMKKSALQGNADAQAHVAMDLIECSDRACLPGTSCYSVDGGPEALFWARKGVEAGNKGAKVYLDAFEKEFCAKCIFCEKRPKVGEHLSRCTRCKGSFYCSRECQEQHWRVAGHKDDCYHERKMKRERAAELAKQKERVKSRAEELP
jgi:TPR repeat protein